MNNSPKVRIKSKGNSCDTEVLIGNEVCEYVTKIEWSLDAKTGLSSAIIHFLDVEIDAESSMENSKLLYKKIGNK